ncbi:hypothetical protein QR680_006993 [Steinernema hermaphroditum]|uniref:Uncharacterized protein n=1 Tax=Steinernema hermaphroditum TaxID=289476 RepID=A0AA39HZG3_9BILA|nr:hypothetical protein QR680_006993 [Steinernema hermaphroditum]
MATKPVLLSGLLLCVLFLSVASNDDDLCIHSWVKKQPEGGSPKNQTTFIPELWQHVIYAEVAERWSTDTLGYITESEKFTYYKSTKPYCLYFKPVDEALTDVMYSNDIHHAILLQTTMYDILSFHKSVAEVCSKPGAEEAGIGHVKRLITANTSLRLPKWVKVKWYCCQPAHCGKTIDEIETRMLTMLLPVNYQPKKSNFYGNYAAGARLKKRSISPCFDIYGERYEFATPHYDTPACPVYAFYDAKSPSYEFNHMMSRKRSALNEMWKTCLFDSKSTENTCIWNYKGLHDPVELKCCCRNDLEGCTYKLSNRRQYTRCFQFDGYILMNNGQFDTLLRKIYDRDEAYSSASADACFMTLRFGMGGKEVKFESGAATHKRNQQCLRMLHERNREIVVGMNKTVWSDSSKMGFEKLDIAVMECPANPNEYLYTEKRCVQYHLPNYERLSLLENHNFHVKDYVAYGKFSKCSLLEIELTKNAFTGKTSNGEECADLAGKKKIVSMLNNPLFVLRCNCSGGEICNLNDNSPEVRAIDTRTPCNVGSSEESHMMNIKLLENSEPSYCAVHAGISGKLVKKMLCNIPQTEIITNEYDKEDLVPGCSVKPSGGAHTVDCICQSREHKPCNDVTLLNKAVNLYYGRSRIEISSDDETLECQLDEKREVCRQPGCFLTIERNETRTGCIHRSASLEAHLEVLDRYERRLCLTTGMQNDCKIIRAVDLTLEPASQAACSALSSTNWTPANRISVEEIGSEMSSTVEDSSKAASVTSSVLSLGANVSEYLPESLVNRVEKVLEAKLNYRIEGDKVFYTYKVKWEEDCNVQKPEDTSTSSRKQVEMPQTKSTASECSATYTRKSTASECELSNSNHSTLASEQRAKKEKKHTSELYGTGFDYENAFKDCTKVCSAKSPCRNASHPDNLKKKARSAPNGVVDSRKCDGPCKQTRPIEELHLIGRCEHAICNGCMDKAPYIDTNVGGTGCPNQKCYLTDVAAICPDPERRHRKFQRLLGLPVSYRKPESESEPHSTSLITSRSCTSSTMSKRSPSDKAGITRLLLVKAFIYEGSKKKLRHLGSVEVPSYVSLEKACDYVLDGEEVDGSIRSMKKRSYIAKSGACSSTEWFKVEKSYWDRPIDKFCISQETVNIIFDCTKKSKK